MVINGDYPLLTLREHGPMVVDIPIEMVVIFHSFL